MTDDIVVPHLAHPFRLAHGGSFAAVEQDTVEEVAQCVEILLTTHEGERLEVPDYGIADMVFDVVPDLDAIASEVEEWEPRATTSLEQEIDEEDSMVRHVIARITTEG